MPDSEIQGSLYKNTEIQPRRLESLDVLRGLTVAFMVLVNDPGDPNRVFSEIEHARWNGLTGADLIFPTFLYIMGCAIPFSLGKRVESGESRLVLFRGILRRSLILLLLGWIINLLPNFDFHNWRLFGVLQRFAITYTICGGLFLFTRSIKTLWAIIFSIVIVYWGIFAFIPVPGSGFPGVDIPFVDEHHNIGAWIDQKFNIFTQSTFGIGRLYVEYRDPEGILSSLPAIATVLCGIIGGLTFRTRDTTKIQRWFITSFLVFCSGILASFIFPFNKNLWSSSFTLLCAGMDGILLYALHKIVDKDTTETQNALFSTIIKAAVIFGANPIVIYCVSEGVASFLWGIKVNDSGASVGQIIYDHLFAFAGSSEFTSLLYAIAYVAVCFIPNYVLWKKRIVVKI